MGKSILCSLIVTYNSQGLVLDLLSDLIRIRPDDPIIIVDNASSDLTVETIRNQFPGVNLIQNPTNVGYGRAVNQGIELCQTPYVFILNPDIRIPESTTITKMVSCLVSHPAVGAVGPLQYMVENNLKQLNFICSYCGWKSFTGYWNYRLFHNWPSQKPIKVPFLNAGCLMVRRSAFFLVGKFNPKYFFYGEDPDLGLRFIRHGFENWLLPDVSVVHLREKSLQKLPTHLRWKTRWQGKINIMDALLHGWSGILHDKIMIAVKINDKDLPKTK